MEHVVSTARRSSRRSTGLLDDNRELYIPETQETVRPAPGFMLFATQNPAGAGAGGGVGYGGRKPLSRALRGRFVELDVPELPASELETLVADAGALPPKLARQLVACARTLRTRRRSFGRAEVCHTFGMPLESVLDGSKNLSDGGGLPTFRHSCSRRLGTRAASDCVLRRAAPTVLVRPPPPVARQVVRMVILRLATCSNGLRADRAMLRARPPRATCCLPSGFGMPTSEPKCARCSSKN